MSAPQTLSDGQYRETIGAECLRHLLDWPESAVGVWIRRHKRIFFRDEQGMFTHWLPAYYMEGYFTPHKDVVPLDHFQKNGLWQRIGLIVLDHHDPIISGNANWPEIRRRVDDLLREYGTSLQAAQEDNARWIGEGMPSTFQFMP